MKNHKSRLLLALATSFVLAQGPIHSNAQEDIPSIPSEEEFDEMADMNDVDMMEDKAADVQKKEAVAEAPKKPTGVKKQTAKAEMKKTKAKMKKAKKDVKASRKAPKKKTKARKS